ncbi:MAG: thioredoxin family protein [Candidatus Woesearchaeota archaeon]|nr:thioredoxin family protein [Candidatus Woesearchaeota archaeon]
MKIEILGPGCPKCKKLEANARKALEETVNDLFKDVEVVKITEIDKILDYGIMSTPGIAIDGVVKNYGRIASVDEIKKYLQEYIKETESKYK